MHGFWLIFGFYLFTLSVLPCSEEAFFEKKNHIQNTENHKHKSSENEHCTPFCVCSHCSTTVLLNIDATVFIKKDTLFFIEKEQVVSYKSLPFKEVANSIWQPPKIS